MSGCLGFKQRQPKTYISRLDYSIDMFLQGDFDNWVAANSGLIEKVGDVYSIRGTTSGTTFSDVLRGNSGATVLGYSSSLDTSGDNYYESIQNLGKEIRVGNGVESNLLVFRLVAGPGPSTTEGVNPGRVGYIVVENNATDMTRPRFRVQVAAGN